MSKREWLKNAIFYQIYPQSFSDSNGDGIGDLPGITARLDYIASLGVNALWLNPCFESPFQDAGYDVANFYQVAPRYGTNADLERLFQEAHARGIRVCLDLVAGHTSIDCPWFKASCQHARNAYSDRYIWTPSVWNTGGDSGIRFVNGFAERDGNYAINFFYSQPALNYGFARVDARFPWQQPLDAPGPQANRAELLKIMAYWLDRGADGFRVDMASSLVKNDPDKAATIAFWQETRAWLDERYPEAALIAEWGNPAQAIRAGYDIDFMIHFGTPGYPSLFFKEGGAFSYGKCYFDQRGEGTVTEFVGEWLNQAMQSQGGYISIPSGNHDYQRPNHNRTPAELEVMWAFWLTWPGVPFIYYGDEIGMRYQEGLPSKEGGYARTGTRTPMQWDDGVNAGFSSAAADRLYLPVDPTPDRPTVAEQNQDPTSLLNHVRELVALRQSSPALGNDGEMRPLFAKPHTYPFVYLRKSGDERYIIAVNPAGHAASATIEVEGVSALTEMRARGAQVEENGGQWQISMEGISYGIWRCE